jgi:uncharacterized surface protein with fasciclin (FAS1) repeats
MKLVKKLLCGVAVFGMVFGLGVAMAQDGGGDKAAKKGKMAPPTEDVVAGLAKAAKLTTLNELVKVAKLEEALKAKDVTLFGPTDEAFAAMPKDKLEALKKDAAAAKALLNNLLVTTAIDMRNLPEGGKVKTVGGAELTIKRAEDRSVTVNDAKVVRADGVRGTNGQIMAIDKVLTAAPAAK